MRAKRRIIFKSESGEKPGSLPHAAGKVAAFAAIRGQHGEHFRLKRG